MIINNFEYSYFLPILSFVISILFFLFLKNIGNYINIYDNGNSEKRKIHSGRILPIGGILFYIIFLFLSLFSIFEGKEIYFSFKEQVVILITASIFFALGLLDDKYSISALKKSIIFIILILVLLLNNPGLHIYFIKFDTLEYVLTLENFTIFFSTFCIFCFINAFNMFDGINLQSGLYLFLYFLVFFFKSIDSLTFLCLMIPLIFFLFNNFKNKIFLGNSGSYFLSYIISIYFIKSNLIYSKILVEEILILLLIPGIDMLRLFVIRIIKGKSPFIADNNHIHHLLLSKLQNSLLVVFITLFLTLVPYLIFIIFYKSILVILLQVFLYLFVIYFAQEKFRAA